MILPDDKDGEISIFTIQELQKIAPVNIIKRSVYEATIQKLISDAVEEAAAVLMREYLPKIAGLQAENDYLKQKVLANPIISMIFTGIISAGTGFVIGHSMK